MGNNQARGIGGTSVQRELWKEGRRSHQPYAEEAELVGGEVKATRYLATHRLIEMDEFQLQDLVRNKPKLWQSFYN